MTRTPICFSIALALFPYSSADPAEPVRFTDVTEASGVTFLHRTGAQGGWHYLETMGSGCALFDYDNDGDLDLYLVNGANLPGQPPEGTNALYRNDGKSFTAEGAESAEKIERKEKGKTRAIRNPKSETRNWGGEGDDEIVFTDVTRQAGVEGRGYGMGCVAADYDNDGYTDLYVTGYPESILYHNNGDGTFTDVTRQAGVAVEGWSSGAAFFDYDGDGYLDLFVVRYLTYDIAREPVCESGGVRTYCGPDRFEGASDILFRNNGNGTFTDVTRQAGITASPPGKGMGVVTLDYDDDGDTDLYVANDTTPNFLYRNEGKKKHFTAENAESAEKNAEKNKGKEEEELIRNPQSREGRRSSESSGEEVRNQKGGEEWAFVEVGGAAGVAVDVSGRPQAGMGVDAGDVDGDGTPDLIVTNFSYEPNALYRNLGNGLFVDAITEVGLLGPSTMPLGFGTHLFDFDNDGDLDLFVANGHIYPNVARYSPAESYAQLSQLFRNDGGDFADVSEEAGFTIPAVSRGSAVGDLDGDGDLDLVVSISGGRPRIYRNEVGSRKHWLMVKLEGGPHPPPSLEKGPCYPLPLPLGEGGGQGVGEVSNRDGIGARVSGTAGGRTQIREVRSQSGYLSTSDVRLHFGLGAVDRIERIEVRWPGGQTQTLRDIRADQTLVIEEGK